MTVQLVMASDPEFCTPPPTAAELPLMVHLVSVVVPKLYKPPPALTLPPPSIVSPEIDAVTSPSTWNTPLAPPALTVKPAVGSR